MTVLDRVRTAGIIGVLRAPDPDTALRAIDALVAGGIVAVEVTYSTPEVAKVLVRAREQHPDLLLGTGTLTTVEQVAESVGAGAEFLVTPGYDEPVAAAMLAAGRVTMIGALTPSEVMRAQRAGADAVKIFPASLGGPGFLKALREPFPGLRAVPTGGVSAANLGEWFAAGAFAAGAAGSLCPPALLAAGDFATVRANAAAFTAALAEVSR
jgi:2-dehydro-3-deoxyphosphogluconate aldolase / (4S)-4-hydroxy-2-oxoglutarate aldolase